MAIEIPLKKTWLDRRELAQVVGPGSCLVFKDGQKVVSACNRNGKISIDDYEL